MTQSFTKSKDKTVKKKKRKKKNKNKKKKVLLCFLVPPVFGRGVILQFEKKTCSSSPLSSFLSAVFIFYHLLLTLISVHKPLAGFFPTACGAPLIPVLDAVHLSALFRLAADLSGM